MRLKDTTKKYMETKVGFGTADMRQILIFIGTRYVATREKGDNFRSRIDLQGGHVTELAKLHYGIEFGRVSPHLTQEVMDDFLEVSRDHHIAFGLVHLSTYKDGVVGPEVVMEQEAVIEPQVIHPAVSACYY